MRISRVQSSSRGRGGKMKYRSDHQEPLPDRPCDKRDPYTVAGGHGRGSTARQCDRYPRRDKRDCRTTQRTTYFPRISRENTRYSGSRGALGRYRSESCTRDRPHIRRGAFLPPESWILAGQCDRTPARWGYFGDFRRACKSERGGV